MKCITLFLLAALAEALTLPVREHQKESGKQTGPRECVLKQTLAGYVGKVFDVAFSPDGQLLAGGSEDKTLLWDSQAGDLLRTLPGFSSVAFSPDGHWLASRSPDNKTVKLWDVQTGALVRVLTGHAKGVDSLAFSPDGRLLAAAAYDKVELWDVQAGALVRTLNHTGAVRAMSFNPDGRELATAGTFLEMRVWDVQTGAIVRQFGQKVRATLTSHTIDMADSAAFSVDAHLLACNTFYNADTVVLWDVQTGAVVRALAGDDKKRISVRAFSPDGQLLAVASRDETVKLWDVRAGAVVGTLTGRGSVAFSPDGRLIASVGEDNAVKLWRRAE